MPEGQEFAHSGEDGTEGQHTGVGKEFPALHYYAVMNLAPDASREDVRAAYLRLSQLYHPDRQQDPKVKQQATELFNRIREAYEVLSHPLKRQVYDEYGLEGLRFLESTQVTTYSAVRAHFAHQTGRRQRAARSRRAYSNAEDDSDALPAETLLSVNHAAQVAVDGTGLAQLLPDFAAGDLRYWKSALTIRGASLSTQGSLYLGPKDCISWQYDVATGGMGLSTIEDEDDLDGGDDEAETLDDIEQEAEDASGDDAPRAGRADHHGGHDETEAQQAQVHLLPGSVRFLKRTREQSTLRRLTQMHFRGLSLSYRRLVSAEQMVEGGLAWVGSMARSSSLSSEYGDWSVSPMLTGKVWRRVSPQSSLALEASYGLGRDEYPELVLSHARQLSENWQGHLAWAAGPAPGYMASFVYGAERWNASFTVNLGLGASGLKVTMRRVLDQAQTIFARLRGQLTLAGWSLETGLAKEFAMDSYMAVAARASHLGVGLRLKVGRAGHRLAVPILLYPAPDPLAFVAVASFGATAAAAVEYFIARPLQRLAVERNRRRRREEVSQRLAERRREALQERELLRIQAARSRAMEQDRNGLVIVRALYGSANVIQRFTAPDIPAAVVDALDEVCDVTDALQALVDDRDSSLRLYATSKAALNGFYDPTLGDAEPLLRIWYIFQGQPFEVTIEDLDSLQIGGRS
jgi:hypothetical protein